MAKIPEQPYDTRNTEVIGKMAHIEKGLDGIRKTVEKLEEHTVAIRLRLEKGDARFDNHHARICLQEKIVFGTIGLICTGVLSALLYLVIKK